MTKLVEIIRKKEFAVTALNINKEIFMVHVATPAKPIIMPIYLSCKA